MKEIKANLPFLTLLAAVCIAWGSLMVRVEVIIDKQGDLSQQIDAHMETFKIINDDLSALDKEQAKHDLRITALESRFPALR